MRKIRNLFAFFGIIRLTFAYLDPGTGSLIVQLAVAAIAGVLFVFRSSFRSLLYFFGLRKPPETSDDDIEDIDDVNNNDNNSA